MHKQSKKLNIVIDASWIADRNFTGQITGGALRVIVEFLNQLKNHPNHNFYLTYQGFLPEDFEKLSSFIIEHLNYPNVHIAAVKFDFLRNKILRNLFIKSYRYFPLASLFSSVPRSILNKTDIYYSTVDAIPRTIRKNKKIIKFFTALDLIPLIKPDFSTQFRQYTKKLYDSLPNDAFILAISENTKRDILKYRPDIKPKMIAITYLGASDSFKHILDKDRINSFLENHSLSVKGYFLTINAIAKYKNFEFILDNFVEFCDEQANSDVKLVVVVLSRERAYKDQLVKKYGSNNQIIFLHNLSDEDLTMLYNGARAFLYMSHYEGFGLPILEAMQCGTPVICSDSSSIPEVIGEAGLTCDPSDSFAFKMHLKNTTSNDNLLEVLREKGLIQSKKFSWEIYGARVVAEFEKVTKYYKIS